MYYEKINRTIPFICTCIAFQCSGQSYEVTSSVINAGGGAFEFGPYTLTASAGQHEASNTLNAGGYTLASGFIPTIDTMPTRLCADTNGDDIVNGLDFGAWLGAFNTANPIADVNGDGSVNGLDFGAWLNAFNQGQNGPRCNP